MSFFDELKRRNVFKVGVAYAIVAWLLLQIGDVLFPTFQAPDWAMRVFTLFVILGFPLAIFLAWAFELTPEGIKPTQSIEPDQSITQSTGQKLNYIIIGLMALAIAYFVINDYVLVDKTGMVTEQDKAAVAQAGAASPAPVASKQPSGRLPNSIAVLPFQNLSLKQEDAYFAAGLHEEILNQLARLKNMNVIARTTMDHYAGTDKSMEEIAKELNVETVMEGTVRYANGKVRITAQLIDGKEGVHMWSDTYERQFDDIFAIESDIAMNVANAMVVEFSLDEQAKIEAVPTQSAEAYSLYLEALALFQKRTRENLKLSLDKIDQALALDPNFTQGWLLKSNVNAIAAVFFPAQYDRYIEVCLAAARKAIELDPGNGGYHTLLGAYLAGRGDLLAARKEIDRGEELGGTVGLGTAAFRLLTGSTRGVLDGLQRDRAHNPYNQGVYMELLWYYDIVGDDAQFIATYEDGKKLFPQFPLGDYQALIFYMGRRDKAALRAFLARDDLELSQNDSRIFQYLDTPDRAVAELNTFFQEDPNFNQSLSIAMWAAWFDEPELAARAMRKAIKGFQASTISAWRPVFTDARKQPVFKETLKEIGLVKYWQTYGWPAFCRPVGDDDFECE